MAKKNEENTWICVPFQSARKYLQLHNFHPRLLDNTIAMLQDLWARRHFPTTLNFYDWLCNKKKDV